MSHEPGHMLRARALCGACLVVQEINGETVATGERSTLPIPRANLESRVVRIDSEIARIDVEIAKLNAQKAVLDAGKIEIQGVIAKLP